MDRLDTAPVQDRITIFMPPSADPRHALSGRTCTPRHASIPVEDPSCATDPGYGWSVPGPAGLALERGVAERDVIDALRRCVEHELEPMVTSGRVWDRIDCQSLAIHGHAETTIRARVGERTVDLSPNRALAMAVERHRQVHGEPGRGTWFQLTVSIERESRGRRAVRSLVTYDRTQRPHWQSPPSIEDLERELRVFPRAQAHRPRWLRRDLSA